jgi:hypothetical protein
LEGKRVKKENECKEMIIIYHGELGFLEVMGLTKFGKKIEEF